MLSINLALANLARKDPHIKPYLDEVRLHLERYNMQRRVLCGKETLKQKKSLADIANGHLYFGFHRTEQGWVFREWLPGADAAWLTGADCDLTLFCRDVHTVEYIAVRCTFNGG
jgi:1,4-alpha-glucan branching enzyme